MSILIIDDDPVLVRMYQRGLEVSGIGVETAEDGESGLKKAAALSPKLILLDVMMPKMSGYQVLDQLKASPQTANIPVIVLTNLASQEDINRALEKGAVQCIIKSQSDPLEVVSIAKKYLPQA